VEPSGAGREQRNIPHAERRETVGRGAHAGFVGKRDAPPPPRFVTDFAPDPVEHAISALGELGQTIYALIESQQYAPAAKAIVEHFEPTLTKLRSSEFADWEYPEAEIQLNGLAYLLAYLILSLSESDRSVIKTLSWQMKRWVNRGFDAWEDLYLVCALALSRYDNQLSRELESELDFSPSELHTLLSHPNEALSELLEDTDTELDDSDDDELPEIDPEKIDRMMIKEVIYNLAALKLRRLERQGQVSDYLKLAWHAKHYHRYAIMQALQGDLEGAIETARQEFLWASEWRAFAKALDALGHTETALNLALSWLQRQDTASAKRVFQVEPFAALAEWLATRAAALGRSEIAVEAMQKAFFQNPTFARYQLFQQIAGDQWEQLRSRARQHIKEVGEVEEIVEVYFHEGMYADALEFLLEEDSLIPDYALRLVEHLPQQIREACLQQAEQFMRTTDPEVYPMAVEYLAVVKRSYQVENEPHEWDALIQRLLEQYKRKHGLAPLLQKLAHGDEPSR